MSVLRAPGPVDTRGARTGRGIMAFDRDSDWMWARACELLDRAERLHRQFFRPGRAGQGGPVWQPPVDIFETGRDLWILIALPGVPGPAIEVRSDGGTLVVTGERPLPSVLRGAEIHRLEIPYGRFERRIELPPGRFSLESREDLHGCLALNLRKLF